MCCSYRTLSCSKFGMALTPPGQKAVFDFDELYLRAQVELGAQIGTVGKPYISTFQRVQYERKRTLEQKVMDVQRGTGVSWWGGVSASPILLHCRVPLHSRVSSHWTQNRAAGSRKLMVYKWSVQKFDKLDRQDRSITKDWHRPM